METLRTWVMLVHHRVRRRRIRPVCHSPHRLELIVLRQRIPVQFREFCCKVVGVHGRFLGEGSSTQELWLGEMRMSQVVGGWWVWVGEVCVLLLVVGAVRGCMWRVLVGVVERRGMRR